MAATVEFKYRAFLSYAHANQSWGKWLHRQLEGFRVDKDLVGRETRLGPVPKALRPIFRDREEFSGGHSLNEATNAALDQSAALIVVCSAIAASRPAVNEEARLFRSRHPDRPVIPVIVGGTYPDNFPPALRFELNADGTVSDRPITILGPDVRESGDGRNLALAKIAAALIDVPVDDVFRRAERARRRQAFVRNCLVALFLAVAGTGGYFYFRSSLIEASLARAAANCRQYRPADSTAKTSVLDPVEQCLQSIEALRRGAATDPRDAETLRLLGEGKKDEAEKLQVEAAADDEAAGKARTKKAAERYRIIAETAGIGDPAKARLYYRKAIALDPEDWLSLMPLGINEMGEGNLAEARALLERVLPLTGDRLEILKPIAKIALGGIASSQGDDETAMSYLRDCGAGDKVPWEASEIGRATIRNYGVLCRSYVRRIFERRGDWETSVKTLLADVAYLDEVLGKGDALINRQDKANRNLLKIAASSTNRDLVLCLIKLGRFEEAEAYGRNSVEWASGPYSDAPEDAAAIETLARAHDALGDALRGLGGARTGGGNKFLPEYVEAERLAKMTINKLGDLRGFDESYVTIATHASSALLDAGQFEEGLRIADDVIALAARRDKRGLLQPSVSQHLAIAYLAHAAVEQKRSDVDKELEGYEHALQIMRGIKELSDDGDWKAQIAYVEASIRDATVRRELRALFERRDKAFEAGNYPLAAEAATEVATSAEKYEISIVGHPTIATAKEYTNLALFRLHARDFAGALEASQKAVEIEPKVVILGSNIPHALMFMGRLEEARAAYLAHKGERVAEGGGLWEDELLNDFGEFEKRGLTHPFMNEVRAMLLKR